VPTVAVPWVIAPKDSLLVNYFYFLPTAIGPQTMDVCFDSDAATLDLDPDRKECGTLSGNGINPGPSITGVDFGAKRVLTVSRDTVVLKNTGNIPITISEIHNNIDGWRNNNGRLESPELNGAFGSYYIPNVNSYAGQIVYPESGTQEPKEIRIEVVFEPQSEYTPHGNSNTAVKFYVNFEEDGIEDNTVVSNLQGQGILPKIISEGFTYTIPTKEGSTSSEPGFIQITNPSKTAALNVKIVNYADPVASATNHIDDFKAEPNPFADYSDTLVGIGEVITIPVTFAPTSTNPPNREALVRISSDAKVGPEENPTFDTLVKLEGVAFDEGIEIGSIDFGKVMRCDAPTENLLIENLSTTTTLTIDSVLIENGYENIFEIISPATPFSIAPNGNQIVQVRFNASEYMTGGNPGAGEIEAEVIIKTLMGEYFTTIKAMPMIIPVQISLREFANQLPGTTINFPVDIEIPNSPETFYNFGNANITEFTIVLRTSLQALNFEVGNGYEIVSQDVATGLVTIRVTGNNPVAEAGILFQPQVTILLNETTTTPVEIVSISFGDRDDCIVPTFDNGSIEYTICAEDIRYPNISPDAFSIAEVSPNPFTGDVLEVNYSVGFDVDTKLVIYNSNGEIVKTLVDEFKASGKHTATANVSNLSSGAYTIKMKSGPFEPKEQNLIIVR
jgi:hypothetical protein